MTARRAGRTRTTRGRAGQRTHLVINLLWPFLKYSNIQTCKSMIQLYFCASQIDTNRYTLTSVRPRSDPFYNIFYQASYLNQMHKTTLFDDYYCQILLLSTLCMYGYACVRQSERHWSTAHNLLFWNVLLFMFHAPGETELHT